MRTSAKSSVMKRFKRIEGQVRGLARMVEDDRYCIDVVTQLSAVRAALRRAEEEILADHAAADDAPPPGPRQTQAAAEPHRHQTRLRESVARRRLTHPGRPAVAARHVESVAQIRRLAAGARAVE